MWKPTFEFKVLKFHHDRYYDGDTFWLTVQLPFRYSKEARIRLLNFDAWEVKKPRGISDPTIIAEQKLKGKKAKEFAAEFLKKHLIDENVVWIRTHNIREFDNFGRVLSELFVDLPDGTTLSLATALEENGHKKLNS